MATCYIRYLDDRGRLRLPKVLRPQYQDRWVICRSLHGSDAMALYPLQQWEHYQQRLRILQEYDTVGIHDLARHYSSHRIVTCDHVGRVRIPPSYTRCSCLSAGMILRVTGSDVELWSIRFWRKVAASRPIEDRALDQELSRRECEVGHVQQSAG